MGRSDAKRGSEQGTAMLIRRRAVAAVAAGAFALVLASCSAQEPEPEDSPSTSVHVDVDEAPSADPDAQTTPSSDGTPDSQEPSAGSQEEVADLDHVEDEDSGGQEADGQPEVEILTGTGEEDSDYPTDPPAGLSEEEWAHAWHEAQRVARTYIVERYSVSYTDPDPDQWRIDASELSTSSWQDELGQLRSMSGDWDRMEADEVSYLAQVLGQPRLAHTLPFDGQKMTIFIAYRTWENSIHAGNQLPHGWDLYENDFGAPGETFTSLEMKSVDGQWLVDAEGQAPVTGMGD